MCMYHQGLAFCGVFCDRARALSLVWSVRVNAVCQEHRTSKITFMNIQMRTVCSSERLVFLD